jgi:predicted HicB family RNase H-like nuclease
MSTKKPVMTVKTTLYLPKHLHSELKIEAIKRDFSMTQLVIQAIQNELKMVSKTKE